MDLSAVLRYLRRQDGITQKELAQRTGLSLSTIVGYENGKREPNSKAMAALEQYFSVSGGYLRGDIDKDTFASNSEQVQDGLDKIVQLFSRYRDRYIVSEQSDQQRANELLTDALQYILDDILSGSDCRRSDLAVVMASYVRLNQQGRGELAKRADELLMIPRYVDPV